MLTLYSRDHSVPYISNMLRKIIYWGKIYLATATLKFSFDAVWFIISVRLWIKIPAGAEVGLNKGSHCLHDLWVITLYLKFSRGCKFADRVSMAMDVHWNCVRKWRLCITDHDDVIKWKHFPRYWPFVRGIHRSPVNSPHKGQWRGYLMLSLTCAWINGWVNNREAGDLRRTHVSYLNITD